MHRLGVLLSVIVLLVGASGRAAAEPTQTEEAREAFRQGAALARDAQWGAALAAFERSARLHSSAGTTYNIGVCERALGRYVRARRTFARALEERRDAIDLPDATVADIHRFTGEIDGLVATLEVGLAPGDAALAVDGQPLEAADDKQGRVFLTGTLPAGPGKPVSETSAPATFRVALDPGAHVFVITREGFADAVQNVTVRPGEKRRLELVVDRLPASLSVSADRRGAVVTVDALDVGVAPVQVSRPAGRYHVAVKSPGFVTYEVDTSLRPGEKTELRARLEPDKPSLFTRWWFWTAAGVVLVGATATTYVLTRPDPQRPPLDGGGLGWTARAP